MSRVGLSVIAFFGLIGCTQQVVDLDREESLTPTSTADHDPAVVLKQEPASVWVDEQRVYWVSAYGRIQSCRKTDCAHTLLDYNDTDYEDARAVIAGGQVYWTAGGTIFSCAAEGCQPRPLVVTQDPALRPPAFADGSQSIGIRSSTSIAAPRLAAPG
jgi:hypothetical protein